MTQQIPCQRCGEPFAPRAAGRPQIFCSKTCRDRTHRANHIKKYAPIRASACAECGARIVHADRGRPRRFCSDECKTRTGNRALRRRRLPIRDPDPAPRACAHCGTAFIPRRKDQIYCKAPGSWCVQAAYQARRKAGEPLRQVEQTKRCQECGNEFTAHKSNARWCSSQCRRRFTGREESRRRGPVRPDHVPYTDREIFDRDGWRCHLCGKKIDPAASRRSREGATIDHLVPLAAGGADVPANVAAAHNWCNKDKGIRAMNEQLRLV